MALPSNPLSKYPVLLALLLGLCSSPRAIANPEVDSLARILGGPVFRECFQSPAWLELSHRITGRPATEPHNIDSVLERLRAPENRQFVRELTIRALEIRRELHTSPLSPPDSSTLWERLRLSGDSRTLQFLHSEGEWARTSFHRSSEQFLGAGPARLSERQFSTAVNQAATLDPAIIRIIRNYLLLNREVLSGRAIPDPETLRNMDQIVEHLHRWRVTARREGVESHFENALVEFGSIAARYGEIESIRNSAITTVHLSQISQATEANFRRAYLEVLTELNFLLPPGLQIRPYSLEISPSLERELSRSTRVQLQRARRLLRRQERLFESRFYTTGIEK